MAFGREELAHIFMDRNGLQTPILFGEKQVSKLRYSSTHDSYFSLRFAHVFLNVELIPFTLSFKHLLEQQFHYKSIYLKNIPTVN